MAIVVRKTAKGLPDQRIAPRERRIADLEVLLRKPRTIHECAEAIGLKPRAVHVLFDVMRIRGRHIARVGDNYGKYVLVQGMK